MNVIIFLNTKRRLETHSIVRVDLETHSIVRVRLVTHSIVRVGLETHSIVRVAHRGIAHHARQHTTQKCHIKLVKLVVVLYSDDITK